MGLNLRDVYFFLRKHNIQSRKKVESNAYKYLAVTLVFFEIFASSAYSDRILTLSDAYDFVPGEYVIWALEVLI